MATPIRIRPRTVGTLRRAERDAQPQPKARAYQAAQTTRLTGAWASGRTSANTETRSALATLRDRCRERERNDAWMQRFLTLMVNEVVGPTGIRMQSKATTPRGRADQRTRAAVESRWNAWAQAVTPDGKSLTRTLALLYRSTLRDGEAFAVLRLRNGALSLSLLESDFCDEAYNDDAKRIVQGIELDAAGAPVAYYFFTRHPGDMVGGGGGIRERVPAADVLHVANYERLGQVRGVPVMVSALLRMHQLGQYEQAELEMARMQACIGTYFTKPSPEGWEGAPDESDPASIGLITEPGMGVELPAGVQPVVYNPTHPGNNYGNFTRDQLRAIAMAGGCSFHALSGDLTAVNYSSARIGYLLDQEGWKAWQQVLIDSVCEPIFRRWLEIEIAAGRLADLRAEQRAHTWHPKRWRWVDPQKDAAGLSAMLADRLMSPQQAIGESGRDPDEVIAEWQAWDSMLVSRGVLGGPATSAQATAPAQAEPIPDSAADSDDEDGEPEYDDAGNVIPMAAKPTQSTGAAPAQPQQAPAEAQAVPLNGAQVSSLLEIFASVSGGLIDKSSAATIIVNAFPQIDMSEAETMLAGVKIGVSEAVNATPTTTPVTTA